MKRPLLIYAIAMICGIISAYITGSYFFIIFSTAFLAFAAFIVTVRHGGHRYIFVGLVIFYLFGALHFIGADRSNSGKFTGLYGKDIVLKGFVDSNPDIRDYKISYVIRTAEVVSEGRSRAIKGKVLLSVLNSPESRIYGYGREISIKGQLSEPKSKRNPGGFDYRRFLYQSGISATIYSSGDNIQIGAYTGRNILVSAGFGIRAAIVEVIEKSLPREQAGLLLGMLIGYTEGLSDEVKACFSDAGLSHIMAVSGMNVAFIVFPLAFLFKKMRLGERISNSIIIFVLVLFVFVTGFSPSVVRAVIMGIALLAGGILRRETDVYTSIAFSAVLLLALNPYTLFDIGFQLSFAATLSLVMFYKRLKGLLTVRYLPGPVREILAVTLAAQIGVLPITAYYFNKVSLVSMVSNIVVVPLVEAVTIVGFIMAGAGQFSIYLSQLAGYVNCSLLSFILFVSRVSAGTPFAILKVTTPPILLVLLYYAAFLGLFWKEKIVLVKGYKKMAAAAAALVAIVLAVWLFAPKGLEVVFLDVGQGDSAVVRTNQGKVLLIDGGGFKTKDSSAPNTGELVVLPFLMDFGVGRLDGVVATHGDDDHILGLYAVLKQMEVGSLILPRVEGEDGFGRMRELAQSKGVPINFCSAGDRLKLDSETFFSVLHPGAGYKEFAAPLNNSSIVLKLSYGDTRILFTGDIEKEAERELLSQPVDISADVLKVAHHGSKTSSTPELLERVKPKAAVISVGKNNFGHPSEEVLQRLKAAGTAVFRTDEKGAVLLRSDGKRIKIIGTVN